MVIVRAKAAYIAHDGFVPALTEDERYRRKMADMAERGAIFEARTKAYREELAEYHQQVEDAERAARPPQVFRHIETIAEAAARNRAAWAARDALAALASTAASAVATSLPSMDKGVFELGNVSEVGTGTTPLSDAAPFKYSPSESGSDLLSIAARGVSESHEAECHSEYEIEMQQCDALAFHMGGARMMTLCKQNAFDRYQQCRGY
ncbi:hypothetical protein PAMC26577_09220 [Caballeronia sordidicola]|uniref:Uncharacterized protein n=1 Tax=Caballeronia sordidicola TaxID=196367 RepID=A0A242N1W9_CABSO|nr:hypothetical protein PAMC26577_09220 [Caballeronia sordidicola]